MSRSTRALPKSPAIFPMTPSAASTRSAVHSNKKAYGLVRLLEFNQTKHRVSVETLWQGTQKKRMERADKRGATHVLLMLPDGIQLKNMKTGQRQPFDFKDLMKHQERLVSLFDLFTLNS